MKFPFKLNAYTKISQWLPFLPKCYHPKFIFEKSLNTDDYCKSVSSLKFNTTFKTTEKKRHLKSNDSLKKYITENSIILDIGASTGITSQELIHNVDRFKKYFVTDFNLYIKYFVSKNNITYILNNDNVPILIATDYLVCYPQESRVAQHLFKHGIEEAKEKHMQTLLIEPNLMKITQENKNIHILEYNIFDKWQYEQPNIIKIANLLNRVYFSDNLITEALLNMLHLLPENGILQIVENREQEQGALYKKHMGQFEKISHIHKGTNIDDLILSIRI